MSNFIDLVQKHGEREKEILNRLKRAGYSINGGRAVPLAAQAILTESRGLRVSKIESRGDSTDKQETYGDEKIGNGGVTVSKRNAKKEYLLGFGWSESFEDLIKGKAYHLSWESWLANRTVGGQGGSAFSCKAKVFGSLIPKQKVLDAICKINKILF